MLNENSNTIRFVDPSTGMMLHKPEEWNKNGGYGETDALWRTAISYVCYNDSGFSYSIVNCFRKFTMINRKGYSYQPMRMIGRYREDDVSRDQVIMALSSLYFNDDYQDLNEICSHLPYRLSRRFKMGISMKLWVNMLSNYKSNNKKYKLYSLLFGLSQIIILPITFIIAKIVRILLGVNKDYDPVWYFEIDKSTGIWTYDNGDWKFIDKSDWATNGNKLFSKYSRSLDRNPIKKLLNKLIYPEFSLHLTTWMIYCMKNGLVKNIIKKLILLYSEKSNLLINLLMGKNVDIKEIEEYNPLYYYRWQNRLNKTNYSYKLEGDDALFNTIDKDILYSIKK